MSKQEYMKQWRKDNQDRLKKYNQNYFQNHKTELYAYRNNRCAERYAKKKEWLNSIKGELECLSCGEKRIWCLDFHHRDPNEKEGSIGEKLLSWSKTKILREMEKCDVLCKNCHADTHYNQKEDC